MAEGGEQLFLFLPLPTFSCSYTPKPWKEPISQLYKPPPAVRYAPENPSEPSVKSQCPTCSFPHRCQLVRHIDRRAIFGALTASPVQFIPGSVHNHYFIPPLASISTSCAWPQPKTIYLWLFEAVSPPPPSVLAHTPTPLNCNCMEIVHYNAS